MAHKAKTNDWLDLKKGKARFGFDVFFDGKWWPAGDNNGLFLFDTSEARNKVLVEYRKTGTYEKK